MAIKHIQCEESCHFGYYYAAPRHGQDCKCVPCSKICDLDRPFSPNCRSICAEFVERVQDNPEIYTKRRTPTDLNSTIPNSKHQSFNATPAICVRDCTKKDIDVLKLNCSKDDIWPATATTICVIQAILLFSIIGWKIFKRCRKTKRKPKKVCPCQMAMLPNIAQEHEDTSLQSPSVIPNNHSHDEDGSMTQGSTVCGQPPFDFDSCNSSISAISGIARDSAGTQTETTVASDTPSATYRCYVPETTFNVPEVINEQEKAIGLYADQTIPKTLHLSNEILSDNRDAAKTDPPLKKLGVVHPSQRTSGSNHDNVSDTNVKQRYVGRAPTQRSGEENGLTTDQSSLYNQGSLSGATSDVDPNVDHLTGVSRVQSTTDSAISAGSRQRILRETGYPSSYNTENNTEYSNADNSITRSDGENTTIPQRIPSLRDLSVDGASGIHSTKMSHISPENRERNHPMIGFPATSTSYMSPDTLKQTSATSYKGSYKSLGNGGMPYTDLQFNGITRAMSPASSAPSNSGMATYPRNTPKPKPEMKNNDTTLEQRADAREQDAANNIRVEIERVDRVQMASITATETYDTDSVSIMCGAIQEGTQDVTADSQPITPKDKQQH